MSKRHEGPRGDDAQREADHRVQWLDEATGAPDPADPANAAFFDWLARDLRDRQRPDERAAGEARAADFGARMVAALGVARLRIVSVRGAPASRAASVAGSVHEALDAASRERAAIVVDHAVAAGVGRELWDEPAERWVELPPGTPDGRYVALTVAGESMLPALHDGDVVLVRLGPDIARGAVIVARRPEDGYVVKRVNAIGERGVELTSLNPSYPAVRIPRDERLVVGTVVLHWCGH